MSKSCVTDYIKGGDKEAIAKYEKMFSDSSFTIGVLDSEYKEVTVRVMRVPIKTYEFKYKFNVEGNSYKGEHTFSKLPENEIVKIYYLKSDPSFNCVNPEERLEKEKEKESSNSDLYWGIAWGIFCLLAIVGFIMGLRNN